MTDLSRAAVRRALVQSCPAPYHKTLDAMCSLGWRTGICFAGADALAAKARLSRAAVLRHRSWLAEYGYVHKLDGGHRGRTASYAIPALSTGPRKGLKGSQNETLLSGERVSKRDAEAVVGADVVRAPTTTTHAYAMVGRDKIFISGTGWVR